MDWQPDLVNQYGSGTDVYRGQYGQPLAESAPPYQQQPHYRDTNVQHHQHHQYPSEYQYDQSLNQWNVPQNNYYQENGGYNNYEQNNAIRPNQGNRSWHAHQHQSYPPPPQNHEYPQQHPSYEYGWPTTNWPSNNVQTNVPQTNQNEESSWDRYNAGYRYDYDYRPDVPVEPVLREAPLESTGVDLFATLGISDDTMTLDAESLIENYNYETVNPVQHPQQVNQHPPQYTQPISVNNESTNWNYPEQSNFVTNQNLTLQSNEQPPSDSVLLLSHAPTHPLPNVSNLANSMTIIHDHESEQYQVHPAPPAALPVTILPTTTVEQVIESSSVQQSNSEKLVEEAPVRTVELIEEAKCFKCKCCDFVCLEKESVLNHIQEKHQSSEQQLLTASSQQPLVTSLKKFICYHAKCLKEFTTLELSREHLEAEHKDHKSKKANSSKSSKSKVKSSVVLKTVELRNLAPIIKPILPKAQKKSDIVDVSQKKKSLTTPATPISGARSQANPNKKLPWLKKKVMQASYVCKKKTCNIRYSSIEKLDFHSKCHQETGTGFKCTKCSLTSEHWASVANHLWRDHGIDMELHKCDICLYRIYSLSVLENVHKKTHSTEKNHICSVCHKGFKNQKQLINHKNRHSVKKSNNQLNSENNNSAANSLKKTKTKPRIDLVCDACGRVYHNARALRIHENQVHRKLRPFVCSHCGHSAASRSALRVHMRSHTGEKPFKCEECEYSTSDHNSLRRHKMRHSGVRPYKCPFCPYACIQV